MKKFKKIAFSLLICVIAIFPLGSCDIIDSFINAGVSECSHEWSNYIAKTPTCETFGIMEKNCNNCGAKEYEEILPSGHLYKNGICTVCGEDQESSSIEPTFTKIPLPEASDNNAKWTFQDILNKLNSLYINDPYSYESFLAEFSTGYIQEVYVDNLNLLYLNAIEKNTQEGVTPLEITLTLPIGRVSPKNPAGVKFQNIYRVETENGELLITYNDGLQISVGKFISDNQETVINAFGINEDNELIIYYTDNTIAFVGQIVKGKPEANQASFLYGQAESGYSIIKVFDPNAENCEIPLTHRGKPIVRIESSAFKTSSNLKTIKLSPNIEYVEACAFADLPSLQYIIVPDCELTIEDLDYYQKNGNVKFFFEGEREQYITNGSELVSKNFFFKNDWVYVDGIPRGFVS